MSKITKALEKAARERLLGRQAKAEIVTAPKVEAEPMEVGIPTATSKVDPHIVTFFDRRGVIAEQYRMLRTNLQSVVKGGRFKTLLVTSALHNEGKSVTSLNLALTLSQQPHCRVLLVDGDLRKASVRRWLGLESRAGLSEALTNGLTAQALLVKVESTNLTVLPAGSTMREPAEYLDSAKMRELLAQLRGQFDYIIVDSPPLLLVTDPSVLSQQVDGVVLVVRAGRTSRRTLVEAHTRLEHVDAKLIGAVLTHAEYYNPFYGRYYYRYYAEEHAQDATESSAAAP